MTNAARELFPGADPLFTGVNLMREQDPNSPEPGNLFGYRVGGSTLGCQSGASLRSLAALHEVAERIHRQHRKFFTELARLVPPEFDVGNVMRNESLQTLFASCPDPGELEFVVDDAAGMVRIISPDGAAHELPLRDADAELHQNSISVGILPIT